MENIKKTSFIAMIIMSIISFSNLFGFRIAGLSVIIGIIAFFINKANEKQAISDSGLDVKLIGTNFKEKQIYFWVTFPLIMNGLSIIVAKLFLPDFIQHVIGRTDIILSLDKIIFIVFQLAFLALGEEIAWRAFFQKQLNEAFSIIPVLFISSLLFALGHFSQGDPIVVIYDMFFVFVNSIIYGIVFYKSKNAWVSGISHFIANLFSIILLILL